jgi:hypothetical protein
MPAEEGVRLDDYERLYPVRNSASEEEQPEAIAAIDTRTRDLALKNEELVTKQCIFGEEFRAAEWEIGEHPGE